MTDPMHDRCPALEPGTGERCVLYAKHISDRTGVHVATGSWPVKGSTPLDSPARVGICGDVAPSLLNGVWTKHCTLPAGHDGWHEDDATPPMRWTLDEDTAAFSFAQQSGAAPAGEVVSVPPPVEQRTLPLSAANEILHLLDERDRLGEPRVNIGRDIDGIIGRLWVTGVEEGRRQHADGPDAALALLVGPVLIQVTAERMRQDARWGEQNHPDGTNLGNAGWRDHSRDLTEVAAKQGRVTWAHILQEEFVEALAEVEPARIRAELIQTAAVAVAWIQAIDRRQA